MDAFNWKHFEAHIILMVVRWYLAIQLKFAGHRPTSKRQRSSGYSYHNHALGSSI